ncbi:MAG TPA: hypothetical protein VKB94_02275, partial [Rhizomicrobium sp.]|nr:hypothetical protein [Rhizomicrobium sp.]
RGDQKSGVLGCFLMAIKSHRVDLLRDLPGCPDRPSAKVGYVREIDAIPARGEDAKAVILGMPSRRLRGRPACRNARGTPQRPQAIQRPPTWLRRIWIDVLRMDVCLHADHRRKSPPR